MLCAVCREDLDASHFQPAEYLQARIHASIPRCLSCWRLTKRQRIDLRNAAVLALGDCPPMKVNTAKPKKPKPTKAQRKEQRKQDRKKRREGLPWEALTRPEKRKTLLERRPESELILERELTRRKMGFQSQVWEQGYWVDFRILPRKLGIEVDGGYHFTPEQRMKDEERTKILEKHGWTILRFTNEDVQKNLNGVIYAINVERHQFPSARRT
jgi:very-short-patch-repair endonuclease